MSYEAAEYGGLHCKCERCGYSWRAYVRRYGPKPPGWRPENDLPKRCARCRSKYWNKPRTKLCGFASSSPHVHNPSLVRRQFIEAQRAARAAEIEARAQAFRDQCKQRERWRLQKRRQRKAAGVRKAKKRARR